MMISCRVVHMNIRSALLPCSLLLFSCSQLPKDQAGTAGEGQVADQAVQPASASEQVVTAVALPEVRYYLIADT
jgi:hypothetical protein